MSGRSGIGDGLDWSRDGRHWPNHECSRFVEAGGLRWHVQQMGHGPVALLIHGTGSSTHSWRDLMPLLARDFTVLAMDLPGHAFTGTPAASQFSLEGLAALVHALVASTGLRIDTIVGHSAGAAIGARLVLDGWLAPSSLVAINGAFLPLPGLSGLLFPPVARLMAASSLIPRIFARQQRDSASVARLVTSTGSRLDAAGLALYASLVRDPRHVAGALTMMARWDLTRLARDLGRFRTPLAAIVGANDLAVPPTDATRVRAMLPSTTPSSIDRVARAGHLLHEEQPAEVARVVVAAVQGWLAVPAAAITS